MLGCLVIINKHATRANHHRFILFLLLCPKPWSLMTTPAPRLLFTPQVPLNLYEWAFQQVFGVNENDKDITKISRYDLFNVSVSSLPPNTTTTLNNFVPRGTSYRCDGLTWFEPKDRTLLLETYSLVRTGITWRKDLSFRERERDLDSG